VDTLHTQLSQAEEARSSLEGFKQEMRGLCEGKDPQVFIPELTGKIKQSQVVLSQMQTDLTMIEQLQANANDETSIAADQLSQYAEEWTDWVAGFLSSDDEPPRLQVEGKTLKALEPFITGLRRQLVRLQRDVRLTLEESDREQEQFAKGIAVQDSAVHALRVKAESFTSHIAQQEKLVRKITEQNASLETALAKQAETAKRLRLKGEEAKRELKEVLKERGLEAEEVGRVLHMLKREAKGNTANSLKDIGRELGRILSELAHAENAAASKTREAKDLQSVIEQNLKDYESSKRDYYAKVTTMNRQIENLTHMVEQNDAHSHEVLRRFQQSEAQVELYQGELSKAEEMCEELRTLRGDDRRLAGSLLQCLKVLVERHEALKRHKEFYAEQVDSFRDRLKAVLGPNYSGASVLVGPMARLRRVGLGVLAVVRLMRSRGSLQGGQVMHFKGVPLHLTTEEPCLEISGSATGSELVYSALLSMDSLSPAVRWAPTSRRRSEYVLPYYLTELSQVLDMLGEAQSSEVLVMKTSLDRSEALVAGLRAQLAECQSKS
jgi:chromosome segregation ATPase